MDFEEKYLDVLQNLEFGIIEIYRQDRTLLDRDVADAIEGLIRHYNAEARQVNPPRLFLSEKAQAVFESVKLASELRLGRRSLTNAEGAPFSMEDANVSLSEIIACLKRIQSSVRFWTKEGGRQGYLNYVQEFIR